MPPDPPSGTQWSICRIMRALFTHSWIHRCILPKPSTSWENIWTDNTTEDTTVCTCITSLISCIVFQAIDALEGATRVKPVAPIFVLLGKTQMKAQQWQNAVASFEKAIDIVVSACMYIHITFLSRCSYIVEHSCNLNIEHATYNGNFRSGNFHCEKFQWKFPSSFPAIFSEFEHSVSF